MCRVVADISRGTSLRGESARGATSARDDDDVTRGSPGDLRRDTAEDQPTHVEARARPKDDHVGVLGLRCLEDDLCRVTLPDEERGPNSSLARTPDDRLRAAVNRSRSWSTR